MNRYERKRKTQKKLKKLHDNNIYFVYSKSTDKDETYYQPLHMSGCRKVAKRQTNKRVRNSRNDFKLKGCAYRRKFDYWWTLF